MREALGQQQKTTDLLYRLGIAPLQLSENSFNKGKIRLLEVALKMPNLSVTAMRLFGLIVAKTRCCQGFYYPSIATLAATLGVTTVAVRRAARLLERSKLIVVDLRSGPAKTNRYFLNFTLVEDDFAQSPAHTHIYNNTSETNVSGFSPEELRFINAAPEV